ncbi:hypothetical protein [Acidiphilium sp.]|uniref:hypothetical protein n=1 Tax=Acidiphilium sp. TaxID=527 RepID=UPI00258DF5DA|nr:hypothetical protein [Acidiphilium sp.]
MNTSRLLEIIEKLLSVEKDNQYQQLLNNINSSLGNMVNQPTQPAHQNSFVQALNQLRNLDEKMSLEFQPSQYSVLEEIGAKQYFISNISDKISNIVNQNAATLAVAHQKIGSLIGERQSYLNLIQQLQQNLIQIGIKTNGLNPGQAEIGFLLPRNLFQNEFEHLLKELQVVRRVIRAFSEVATGSAEPIEVRQISTSDPLFLFGLSPNTIAMLGASITWALHTWKQVEQIRQIRSQASQIPAFNEAEINTFFEAKIQQQISKAMDEQTAKILAGITDTFGRKHEQEKHIKWALESLITRIERGLSVEIRFLPPHVSKQKDGQEPSTIPHEFNELSEIVRELEFPRIEETHILELPPDKPDIDEDNTST